MGGSCSDSVISVNKNEKKMFAIPVKSVGVARNMKHNNAEGEGRGKKKMARTEEAKGRCLRKQAARLSNWRPTQKEKTSPQTSGFVNNCIVFKVQEFMYKNTVVLASAPQRKKRTEERHKLWGGERGKKSKIQKLRERIYIKRSGREQ